MPFKAVLLREVSKIDTALKDATTNISIFMSKHLLPMRIVSNFWYKAECFYFAIYFHENGIKSKIATFPIVAQLRYEYALNLLQRFGSSLSRVGLDFVNHQ